jgi:hypothetical protein
MKQLLFFLMLFCCFFDKCEAKTIHAILVVDTVHADVSFMTRMDLKNVQAELRNVAKHTQAILKEKMFIGREFSKVYLTTYLQSIQFDPNDSVFFYFSGHGYRTMQKATSWPYLSFDLYKVGLDMQWIVDKIQSKKPRFALILADCCNNYAERGINREIKNIYINLYKIAPRVEGYRQLFINAKGCVAICSSGTGQFSYGSHLGGLFTLCFLSSLNKEIAQGQPSWKNLLQRAYSYIGRIQKPICKVYR